MNETERLNEALDALQRMRRMWGLMMERVNHGASFYDAETIREMNEAPIEAEGVLRKNDREVPEVDSPETIYVNREKPEIEE